MKRLLAGAALVAGTIVVLGGCGGGGGGDGSAGGPGPGPGPGGGGTLAYAEASIDPGQQASIAPSGGSGLSGFTISPALPAGLGIDASTGVISGTTNVATPKATYTVSASSASGPVSAPLALQVRPATLHVVATATDPDADTLSYQWKVTAGSLNRSDSPVVDWTLDYGQGLQSIYLLLSDGKGGYAEKRVVVNSDDLSVPIAASLSATTPTAPASAAPSGGRVRGWIGDDVDDTGGNDPNPVVRTIYLPDLLVRVRAADPGTGALMGPVIGATTHTSLLGDFTFPSLPPGTYECEASDDGGATYTECGPIIGPFQTPDPDTGGASTDYRSRSLFSTVGLIVANPSSVFVYGHVTQADGTLCGHQSPYFGDESAATVVIRRPSTGAILAGPTRVNAYGDFGLRAAKMPPGAPSVNLEVTCEGAATMTVSISLVPVAGANTNVLPVIKNFTLPNRSPAVSSITASLAGRVVASMSAGSAQPSDGFANPNAFLARKGLDTKLSACQYYLAIGAVASCDAQGNPSGAITFEDWRKRNGMAPYPSAATEVTATYVNAVDLNLVRRHHAIDVSPTKKAFYVCNHAGPDATHSVDAVIDAAVQGKSHVACVAMDYSITPGQNGGNPYVKFHIFGPTGQLMTSINLDGRGEKYVPGSCVACHGADHYAGRFPEDGSGSGNIGAHFLPYDVDNFRFSSRAGLQRGDQLAAIKQLNQIVASAALGTTAATKALVNGWYPGGGGTAPVTTYVPASWQAAGGGAVSLYGTVFKTYCRTCHTALSKRFDFDDYTNNVDSLSVTVGRVVCGGHREVARAAPTMPSSPFTFNLMWNLRGQPGDPLEALRAWYGLSSCALGNDPKLRPN